MVNRNLKDAVTRAISGSSYKWRTVKGIAKEIKASERDVFDVLENAGGFVRSRAPNERGDALYTTADKYRKQTPKFERFLGAAANTVYDD
jgi:hypothetical protein